MEELLAILGLLAAVGVIGWLVGKANVGMNQIQVDQLATSLCPNCTSAVGHEEAEAAYDRAHQFASDHTHARVEMGDYSTAPVVCPSCKEQLIWWVATRTLRKKSDVRS
jgi:hypothetical protein